jgi:hypothetical protein
MDISSKLMELYKDKIESLLANGIAPYYFEVAQNTSATDNEILYVVCFFASFFEHCSQEVIRVYLFLFSSFSTKDQ